MLVLVTEMQLGAMQAGVPVFSVRKPAGNVIA